MIKNASLSLFQTIFSIFSLFYSYKFIIDQLGIEKLGLWTLIISLVSLSKIAELGLSGSVVKYVSSHRATGNDEKTKSVIETVTISVTFLVAVLSIITYIPISYLLSYTLDAQLSNGTLHLLSLAFISSWITVIAGVNKAALDGCQRYDLSTVATITSTTVFVICIIILVPVYSLHGLAFSYIIQGTVLIAITRFQLVKVLKSLPLFPQNFSLKTFKELRSYSFRVQVISIVTMLVEPLTKGMLGKFGGLEMVGYFELANKFVFQMRSLLIAMNLVLVPNVSASKEKGKLNIYTVYSLNYQLISFISVYFFTILLCLVPIIESVWLSKASSQFQLFSIIAVCAWFINTLSVPVYMINLGTGELHYNMVSHIVVGVVNLVLGVLLGVIFGGEGVVSAWGIALVAGTIPIIYTFHDKYKISLKDLIIKDDVLGLFLGAIAVVTTWSLYYYYFKEVTTIYIVLSLLLIGMLVLIPLWMNPTRKVIYAKLTEFIARS